MDDTTAEVVRRMRNLGLRVDRYWIGPDGSWRILVVIPPLESVASGNDRPQN